MEQKFIIEDMTCAHCANKISKSLKQVKGIKSEIDIETKTLTVTSKKDLNNESVISAVASAGYTAKSL